jgi:hypothetical protein
MQKLIVVLLVSVALVVGGLYATANDQFPPLQDGDLIFQTSTSNQSGAILIATANLYTHMGIIKNYGANIVVIEPRPLRKPP